ncbi:MAG: hypothetical protein ACSLFH_01740 [Desulfuromonadales bacterium]
MHPIILFDNRFADATPAANATAIGFDVRHIMDGRAYTFWQGTGAGTFDLTVDCGAGASADCLGIVGHNLSTSGATVQVASSNDNAAWTNRTPLIVPPNGDRAFLRPFFAVSARYWRLRIVAATSAPRLAVAMIGSRLQFPFPPETPYVPAIEDPQSEATDSKAGHLLGEVVRFVELRCQPRFRTIERSWALGVYRDFWNSHGRSRLPFFWAWDLDVFPDHVYWVRHVGRHQEPISVASYVDEIALDLRGVAE